MYDLIDKAEDKSYIICESCGAKGKLRGRGWVRTLCKKCAIKQKYLPKNFFKRQIYYIKDLYYKFKWRGKQRYYSFKYYVSKKLGRDKLGKK